MTYSTRSLTLEDAARIVEIKSAAEVLEPCDETYSVQDVIEELTADGVNLPAGSIALMDTGAVMDMGIEDAGKVVAYGTLMCSPVGQKWRAYLTGDVDPAYRCRGLGTQVLQALVEQAIKLRDQVDPALPIELKMWVTDARVSEAALAASMGFAPTRWFFRMGRELSEPVATAPEPEGITIRRYRETDSEQVRLASNDSFTDHWGSLPMDPQRWQSLVTGVRAFLPELSFVAETVGPAPVIVGFSMNEEYEAETQAHGYATGWVNRLGVTRAVRGAGIATALLLSSLHAFKDAGYQDSALMVDGDSPTGAGRIYQKVGYRTIDRTTTYLAELPPNP